MKSAMRYWDVAFPKDKKVIGDSAKVRKTYVSCFHEIDV
jgi:hypothetical protein